MRQGGDGLGGPAVGTTLQGVEGEARAVLRAVGI